MFVNDVYFYVQKFENFRGNFGSTIGIFYTPKVPYGKS